MRPVHARYTNFFRSSLYKSSLSYSSHYFPNTPPLFACLPTSFLLYYSLFPFPLAALCAVGRPHSWVARGFFLPHRLSSSEPLAKPVVFIVQKGSQITLTPSSMRPQTHTLINNIISQSIVEMTLPEQVIQYFLLLHSTRTPHGELTRFHFRQDPSFSSILIRFFSTKYGHNRCIAV